MICSYGVHEKRERGAKYIAHLEAENQQLREQVRRLSIPHTRQGNGSPVQTGGIIVEPDTGSLRPAAFATSGVGTPIQSTITSTATDPLTRTDDEFFQYQDDPQSMDAEQDLDGFYLCPPGLLGLDVGQLQNLSVAFDVDPSRYLYDSPEAASHPPGREMTLG